MKLIEISVKLKHNFTKYVECQVRQIKTINFKRTRPLASSL